MIVCAALLVSGCGGNDTAPAPAGATVIGSVSAPAGVALGRAAGRSAAAAGLSAKAGVSVAAYLIDDSGVKTGETLATATTTAAGAYTLTLPPGTGMKSNLVVVVGTGNNQMRAIAATTTVAISPMSELVTSKLVASAQPLSSFTVDEVAAIAAQVETDSAAVDFSGASTISAAVTALNTGTAAANIDSMVASAGSGTFAAGCGNAIIETSEVCDDGNKTSGDGCSSVCKSETSKIVYNTYVPTGTGNRSIARINNDGTGKTSLTDATYDDFAPAWSKDGKKIIFCSKRAGDSNIALYVMNEDGAGVSKLKEVAGDDCSEALWSPAGDKIAMWTYSRNNAQDKIYVMGSDGSGGVLLGSYRNPVWSADGSKLYFIDVADSYKVKTIKPDGTGVATVSDTFMPYPGELAPDGTTMLFVAWNVPASKITGGTAEKSGLFYGNADLTGTVTLIKESVSSGTVTTYLYYGDKGSSWSPDGTKIVYDKISPTERKILISNKDGSGETLLVDTAVDPDWYK